MLTNIKPQHQAALAHVRAHGPCLVADVASALKERKDTTRTILNSLVAKGLLKKRRVYGTLWGPQERIDQAAPPIYQRRSHVSKFTVYEVV